MIIGTTLNDFERMDPSSLDQLIVLLKTLLASPSPLTLGASLTAFNEICPDRLDILHPYYRHICRILVDADEWGQVVALSVLTRYARTMLEKPEPKVEKQEMPAGEKATEEESEDEFDGLDVDLAMFLHLAKPLFQSRNPAVVMAIAKAYYHLAPLGNKEVGQELLVEPLLRLAGGSGNGRGGDGEVAVMTWDVIGSMVVERPVSNIPESVGTNHTLTQAQALFIPYHSRFLLHLGDSAAIKKTKLRSMVVLVSKDNAIASMREFKVCRLSRDSRFLLMW